MIANRYVIQEQIGTGGTGVVFRALDRLDGVMVALKRLRATLPGSQLESTVPAFDPSLSLANEFQAMAGLRHPHIVSVLDYGIFNQRPYMTMALIEDARNIVEYANDLAQDQQIDLLMQVLQALIYLHRRGMVHRDIKPGNILVDASGMARVTDFGLAMARNLSASSAESIHLAGTIAYMAPELFNQQTASTLSDLFALGIVAAEVLTGAYPFDKQSTSMMLYSILSDPPALRTLRGDLVDWLHRLLAKNPAERYPSAADALQALCATTGRSMPDESISVRESFLQASEFVGREVEINTLHHALFEMLNDANGTGSAWLIGGESGVGKSRLIDELRTRAVMRGVLVLRGQGRRGVGPPYQFWRTAVRQLVLTSDLSDTDAAILKPIVPQIEDLLQRSVPDIPALNGRERQQRLIETIKALFQQQTTPILLILEDLHWSEESRDVLRALLPLTTTQALFIIGSYRNDEDTMLPASLPQMRLLTLERLDDDAIAQLATSMIGYTVQPALVDFLKRETEGNAFFMVEVVRTLAEDVGSLNDIGRMTLPHGVLAGGMRDVVQQRLQRVPEWAQPLLQIAAIKGRILDTALLAHIVATENGMLPADHTLDSWLLACSEAAVLVVADNRWKFAHDKLREALLNDTVIKAQCYRISAQAIERTYPNDTDYDAQLLQLWYQAGDVNRQLDYLESVVNFMIQIPGDIDGARQLIERTRQHVPDGDARQTLPLILMSETYQRIDYQRGEAYARQALHNAEQHGQTALIGRCLYQLGACSREQGRYNEARDYHHHSLQIAEMLDDTRLIAANIRTLGIIEHDLSHYDKAQAYYERSLHLYQQLNNQAQVSLLYVLHGALVSDQKDYERARQYYEMGLNLARDIRYRAGIAHALNNLGLTMHKLGETDTAIEQLGESLSIYQEIDNRWGIANCHINLAFTTLAMGNHTASRHYLQQGLALSHAISAVNLCLEALAGFAQLDVHDGDYERAAELAGLIAEHPAHNIDVAKRYDPLMSAIKPHLSANALSQAMQRGRQQTLDMMIEQVLYGEQAV